MGAEPWEEKEMNIPTHECDECGSEAGYRETMNCLCDTCFQKALDEAEQKGKDEATQ